MSGGLGTLKPGSSKIGITDPDRAEASCLDDVDVIAAQILGGLS